MDGLASEWAIRDNGSEALRVALMLEVAFPALNPSSDYRPEAKPGAETELRRPTPVAIGPGLHSRPSRTPVRASVLSRYRPNARGDRIVRPGQSGHCHDTNVAMQVPSGRDSPNRRTPRCLGLGHKRRPRATRRHGKLGRAILQPHRGCPAPGLPPRLRMPLVSTAPPRSIRQRPTAYRVPSGGWRMDRMSWFACP
jgi:hypothetical protein